ncbi:MAG: outer membrane protein assembly factor BamA [Gammaproteobacteria bacterium RIFCSPHIGHO2_12_FULL_45_9]|nr:MAG: outer membrane protein assembly factor BamA [Gammaproteobacteria bacterium RIFCSPHIGHO2_12_FULL_45_9]
MLFKFLQQRVRSFFFVFLLSGLSLAWANGAFVVQRIEFVGLQNISEGTAKSYLPIHVGETFTALRSEEALRALYKTGFFNNIEFSEKGQTLIVHVQERPAISRIRISGNDEISTKDMRPILSKIGFSEGDIFNPLKLQQFKFSLMHQYETIGYRAATVTSEVKPLPHNRVEVDIQVHEGDITTVKAIHFEGNHVFSSRTLRRQMSMKTWGLFTFFTHTNRYSEEKFNEDLQSITNFYLNHGYLTFRIVSKSAELTPDHQQMVLNIVVHEGPQFKVSGFDVSGQMLGFHDQLIKLVKFKPGDTFSRQLVLDTNTALGEFLADRGYAFASAEVKSHVDEERHTVFLEFVLTSHARVYVHRITFSGNDRTKEEVLRREMRQMEGGAYSLSQVNESKRRLNLLPYFKDTTVSTQPVPNVPDQVDLDYHINEVAAGKASVNFGYSDAYGFLYGAGISEPNFLGSGNSVSLGFNNSQVQDYYNFSIINPYITVDGVSQSFNIYYSHTHFDPEFNYQTYTMDSFGADLNYGIPLSEHNSVGVGVGYAHVMIDHVNASQLSPSQDLFLTSHPSPYDLFKVLASLNYNGLDRYIFPTQGIAHSVGFELGVPVMSSSLAYYKATDSFKWFIPIWRGFILNLVSVVGFGDGYGQEDTLPFFLNYYAGGLGAMGQVPAYSPNSLGPKNVNDSYAALGGNLLTAAGAHLILPDFINENVRTAIVFDLGNVYQVPINALDSTSTYIVDDDSFSWDSLRLSLGFEVSWYSPFGPINLSLAFPLSSGDNDQLQAFQFSFGTTL